MATVVCEFSMSLDGYVATSSDGVGEVFGWHGNGPVHIPTASSDIEFRVSEASEGHVRDMIARAGAMLTGRRTFDMTDGWDGRHPFDVPVVVLTHRDASEWQSRYPDAPFTFTSSFDEAVSLARETAGDGMVAVHGPNVAQQLLAAGECDEVVVNLVPVLLGSGVSFFGSLPSVVRLADPVVEEGSRVTHLRYRVEK